MNRFDRLSYQYVAETLGATALFVAASWFAREYLPDKPGLAINVLVSLVATVPMLLALWAMVRYFRRVDERERHIMAVAGSITLLIGVSVAFFLAKLEAFLTVDLNLYAAFLFVMWSLATVAVRWKV
ncbi:hypothetical protein [Roseibium sp. Sym1]|uniref:hypothetical protein n=1 Tax=Roseibium sp. Sym1 TaxID=3016006 RepID=UPI0022B2E885|nr:hypothetical protein [Roseibium sp. Sym1]